MRELTLASGGREGGGAMTVLQILSGSHLSSLMHTNFPFPTRHTMPFLITSLALKMLFHAYEPRVDSLASKMEQLGNNLCFKP